MKHNNQLPNNHFKKTAIRYRNFFDQESRALRREKTRVKKSKSIAPMPLHKLRPVVRCGTMRYNMKQRLGRGFTPRECQAAGLDINYARTIGISVDLRRKNRSVAAFEENVQRLKTYVSRLTFYKTKEEAKGAPQYTGVIMPVVHSKPTVGYIKASELKDDLKAEDLLRK
ncbi:60S ribosomal protein L13 [Astathelohania contejeani]|uniref:60S ribosomal protein L13 n=1 Tax=Astathelohania contejeani TaxID=164912 RepID=A0ABQ7I2W9_9MICR|nr:60S ribosomal protein L13 [Thelohania contejeani]